MEFIKLNLVKQYGEGIVVVYWRKDDIIEIEESTVPDARCMILTKSNRAMHATQTVEEVIRLLSDKKIR